MPPVRRLTAILAADVAGYSRLMGADEEGTHERLRAHLRELVDPKIKEHRGRTVKNTGDGFLAEFASIIDAVRCAVEVQRGMIDREPEAPDEQRIRFRIGINLGDVETPTRWEPWQTARLRAGNPCRPHSTGTHSGFGEDGGSAGSSGDTLRS
jgi:class 3 adenylate cyclase